MWTRWHCLIISSVILVTSASFQNSILWQRLLMDGNPTTDFLQDVADDYFDICPTTIISDNLTQSKDEIQQFQQFLIEKHLPVYTLDLNFQLFKQISSQCANYLFWHTNVDMTIEYLEQLPFNNASRDSRLYFLASDASDMESYLTADVVTEVFLKSVVFVKIDQGFQVFGNTQFMGTKEDIIKLDKWFSEVGWGSYRKKWFWDKSKDLNQRELRLGTLKYSYCVTKTNTGAGTEYGGVDIEVLRTMGEKLNYRPKIIDPADGLWGVQLENGTWIGLVGLIYYGRIHGAFSCIVLHYERGVVVDMPFPYAEDSIYFVSPKPIQKIDAMSIVRPYEKEVWLLIAITLLLVPLIAYVFFRKEDHLQIGLFSLDVFRSHIYQPISREISNGHMRLMVGSLIIYTLVIASAYRGSLVAHLTYPFKEQGVDTFEKLIDSDYSISTQYFGGVAAYFFENSPDPDIRALYDKFEITDIETGVKKVLETRKHIHMNYEVLFAKVIAESYMDDSGEQAVLSSKDSILTRETPCLRKYSALTPHFKMLSLQFLAAGLIEKWKQDTIRKTIVKTSFIKQVQSDNKLKLEHLQGAFWILLCGLSISFLTYLGEYIIANTKRDKGKESIEKTAEHAHTVLQ